MNPSRLDARWGPKFFVGMAVRAGAPVRFPGTSLLLFDCHRDLLEFQADSPRFAPVRCGHSKAQERIAIVTELGSSTSALPTLAET